MVHTVPAHCAETGAIVLAQTPIAPRAQNEARDVLDRRYPEGSRVVLIDAAYHKANVLSKGLFSAGVPVLSYDGTYVVFCGKAAPGDDWQIYTVNLATERRHALTSIPGGAMDPALLPTGEVVFAAPVTKSQPPQAARTLYIVAQGAKPHPLTFTTSDVSDPTVLGDGRVLFVEHHLSPGRRLGHYNLLTINNDGTEVTEFAELPDPTAPLRRPRQLPGGRIAFLLLSGGEAALEGNAEFIQSARPFHGAQPLLPERLKGLSAVEPATKGLLACLPRTSETPGDLRQPGVYRILDGGQWPVAPLFSDSDWKTLEAVEVSSRPPPMGRLSNVDSSKSTGQILCLNANFTSGPQTPSSASPVRVRVLVAGGREETGSLGDIPLQADGSFMAEVPANVALGFETLDSAGNVLQRVDPGIWVRPGENRSCIGCHEPHNQAPRNIRPLAVRVPVPVLPLRGQNVSNPLVKR